MKNPAKSTLLLATIATLFAFSSVSAEPRNCGTVMGKKIEITRGNLSCTCATKVFKAFMAGQTPKGWTCGQSVGGCGNGKEEFTFR